MPRTCGYIPIYYKYLSDIKILVHTPIRGGTGLSRAGLIYNADQINPLPLCVPLFIVSQAFLVPALI